MSRFGFRDVGAKLCRRQLILLGFDARLRLLERFARILQFVLGGQDEFTLRPLGGVGAQLGQPQPFQGVGAERLCAGLGLAGVLLHAAEDIGRLIHQIQGRCSLVRGWRRRNAEELLVPPN